MHRIRHGRFRLREAAAALAAMAAAALLSPLPVSADGGVCAPGAHEAPRPSIGLALGGGGARGAAHVGVLRALEEMRIPIDCIAGTSMGAVVGGLYAAGLSPDEMERELRELDWATIFLGRPPRREWPSHRRREDVGFLARFPLGVRDGEVILPGGLIEGQELEMALRRLTRTAAPGHIDFDRLAVPFHAVTADLETGEAVVLAAGDLATAIRASMALPGVFAPVELDGRLLVDGGIAANVPVAAVRAMGADIIIAVDVGAPALHRDELLSVLHAPRQVTTLLIRQRTEAQRALLSPGDVWLEATPPDLALTDFHRAADGVGAGELAAWEAEPHLRPHGLPPAAFTTHRRQREHPPPPLPVIDSIRVTGVDRVSAPLIRHRIRQPLGAPLDAGPLEQDVRRLYALDYFDRIGYRVEGGPEDPRELVIDAVERHRGRHHLRLGLNLEEDFEGGNAYNLLLRHQRMPLNRRGGEWTNEIQAGERPLLRTALHQPLDYRGRWFVAPEARAESYSVDRFVDGRRVTRYRVRSAEARAAVGRTFFHHMEVRAGAVRTTGEVRTRIGDEDPAAEGAFNDGALFAEWRFDTLDSSDFPTRGHTAGVLWSRSRTFLGADAPGRALSAHWFSAGSLGAHTVGIGGHVETSRNIDDPAIHRLFPLGGFLNLSGYRRNELYGHHAALGRIVYYRRMGIIDAAVQLPVFLGGSLEAGNVWDDRDDISRRDLRHSGSLFAGADTAFGPLYLAIGQARDRPAVFYFYLGRTF